SGLCLSGCGGSSRQIAAQGGQTERREPGTSGSEPMTCCRSPYLLTVCLSAARSARSHARRKASTTM
ncbi:hypothetical protein INR49_010152, partial [Caranx melampygus]